MAKLNKISLIGFFKKAHRNIPPRIQKLYMPFVSKWSYRLQKSVNLIYPPVFIFEGLEKNSQSPLAFAYAGFDTRDTDYWAQAVLSADYRKHVLGRHFFWNLRAFLKKGSFNCAFIFQEHNRLTLRYLSSGPGFRVPFWISMEMDISLPFKELLGHQRLDMQRRIRKNGLSHVITRDVKCFDDFYYNMFLPYIQGRHEHMAFLGSYEELLKVFSKGGLVLIKKGDQVLAGGLYELDGSLARLRKFGVRDGKWEYVRYGVLGAAYYFFTAEMKERGYTKTNLGGTRPLLSDGITRYKMSLNTRLDRVEKYSCLWLTFLKDSTPLRSFLINNPFIFFDKRNDAYRAIFIEVHQDTPPEELEGIIRSPVCGGIKETHLFVFGGIDHFSNKVDCSNIPSLRVKSAEDMVRERP